MKESTKAMKRRATEQFDWKSVIPSTGKGLDVGCGDDCLPGAQPFDWQHGDANALHLYFKKETFDYIHASQVVEHLHDPETSLKSWLRLLKKGGHLIFTVPDFELYEKYRWPSRFNVDHKAAFSLTLKIDSSCPVLNFVPEMLKRMAKEVSFEALKQDLITTGYDFTLSPEIDQTLEPYQAECFIEVVLKRT